MAQEQVEIVEEMEMVENRKGFENQVASGSWSQMDAGAQMKAQGMMMENREGFENNVETEKMMTLAKR
jgi:hypothetical protein